MADLGLALTPALSPGERGILRRVSGQFVGLGKLSNAYFAMTTTTIRWSTHFARRTALMKRNAVRELLKVTARPEVISFAGGLPAAELFPVDAVRKAAAAVLRTVGPQSLQYTETEGIPGLREWLARRYSRSEFQVRPENVLVTSGSQQALDLIGRVLVDEGDAIVVENPTYLAALTAWRPFGANFIAAESDGEGIRVDSLGDALAERPKLVYLVPNFQNPSGTTLSLNRRHQLVTLTRASDTIIVEDDPYGDLRYEGRPLPSILHLAGGDGFAAGPESHVVHLGTFSKTLAPGLRVGWVIAAAELIEKLALAKQAADLHTSTFCQHLVLELVNRGVLEKVVPLFCREYGRRRDAMLGALEKQFPRDVNWTRPEGGMFLLITLPEHLDGAALLPDALRENVAFVPGEEFHLNGHGRNTLRLNFSNASSERIEIGIERLARVIAARC